MEIIQTLRNNAGPETSEALFNTLIETSKTVETRRKESECQEELEIKNATLSYEDQLQLLLSNLKVNDKINQANAKPAPQKKDKQQSSNNAPSSGMNYTTLMTQAYHLINEVIMHPQIMWTRNFFYSLAAMQIPQ